MARPFIRPGAATWIRRWRETLAAAGVAALGLWWLATEPSLLGLFGGALALGGGAVTLVAWQRARFRSRGGGAGVVQLDEGRLTYFGPLTGGSVAVDQIVSVYIDPRHWPAHWVLGDGRSDLLIPIDAEGAGTLFDVFAQLPGLDPARAFAASAHNLDAPMMLWRREGAVRASRRLH